jgi:ribosomal protein S27AE
VPQRVFCGACGATLYDGVELESPSEIIRRYNGTCPKCQNSLSFEPERVKILPYDENLSRPKAKRDWGF